MAKDKLAESANELKEKVVATTAAKKQTLDEQVDSIVQDVSHKADDVINTLEKKLAELKARNKKIQKS
ncbi:hypothetical protein [Jejuia pallidilutea]|uniref:Uncharacterized protein n=1 Tax=Jejuia pallidilutea TaxID=504487 RepID=A0A090WY65_9FLAO|nr:hypothetical protein JCM19302_3605 [Jejuia pallidilutea]